MIGLIAPVVEAYGELRVNKGRIMLALIGVALSVFTLTGVMGAGSMLRGALEQGNERMMGRSTVLSIQNVGAPDAQHTNAEVDAVVLEQIDRLGIGHRSRVAHASVRVQTTQGVQGLEITGVDPDYGTMYRAEPEAGRWIADSDQNRLAPSLVVNQIAYDLLGRPEIGSEMVELHGPPNSGDSLAATVIGVLPADPNTDWGPIAFMPYGALPQVPGMGEAGSLYPEYQVWVPPEEAESVMSALNQSLVSTKVGEFEVFPSNSMGEDPTLDMLQTALIVVALAILGLGALGLINISLVTVRYRVREIGIRRSYGATGSRIFFGVLMESVVATFLAGAIGVTAAIALVTSPFVTGKFRSVGLVDLPPFPMTAVLVGLLAATAVGVIAGALPAIIATRIKVIDAIRS